MTEAALELQEEIVQIENAATPEEVLDTRTPAEIEAELMRKAEQDSIDALSSQPIDVVAASFFKMVYPMYKERINGLMAQDAKAVLDALIAYPLENDKPKFRSQSVEAVFGLGTQLLDAKFVIIQAAQMDDKIALDKRSETSDTNNTVVEEVLATVETNFTQGEENG
jgi:hypothetical protein